MTDLRRVGVHPDHWYPVAWSRELKPGKALGVRFAGEPVVLVRPKEGAVFALEDRCAHRQVPLHAGVVDGCALRCCYHGWTYDSTGRCIEIPYLNSDKLPNGVRAYPAREAAGLIFIFPGDPALAASLPFPRLGSAEDPKYRTRRFGKEVACHYSFMHENLMDMNHQFLHRKQMGQDQAEASWGIRRGEDLDRGRNTPSRAPAAGNRFGEAAIFGGRKGPGKTTEETTGQDRHDDPHRVSLSERCRINVKDPENCRQWISGSSYVPLDDGSSGAHRTFGLLSASSGPKMPGAARMPCGRCWSWFTERIFSEDR